MTTKKRFTTSLLALCAFVLAGCGGTESSSVSASVPAESGTSTPVETDYPFCTVSLKASVKEVEIGSSITVRSIVGGDVENMTCEFESSDPSIFTVLKNSTGTGCTITGVKEGKADLIATATDNPTVSKKISITVIPTKPSLRKAFENICNLTNYTFVGGEESEDEDSFTPTTITKVTEDAVIMTDSVGNAITSVASGVSSVSYYGTMIPEGGDKAVYLVKDRTISKTNAPLVRTSYGFLDKANLSGYGSKAIGVDDIPYIYGLRAINPSWLTDEKSSDNTYEIEGGVVDENTGYSTDVKAAYVETLLLKMVSADAYNNEISSLQDNFATPLATDIETKITVLGQNTIKVTVGVGYDTYVGYLQDIGTTTLEDDTVYKNFAGSTASTELIASDLEAGIQAMGNHNYVMNNFLYPDHKTKFNYNTYFTPDYVFYDCSKEFKEAYNEYAPSDEQWDKDPYGYAKKADGIYKFTLNEADNGDLSIAWGNKEANTDASTSVADFVGYAETQDFIASDYKYTYSLDSRNIWSGESTSYHTTYSPLVTLNMMEFYAPEDIPESYDKALSGIGVKLEENVVTEMDFTCAYEPFVTEDDSGVSEHSYGVDRFTLSSFGAATTNRVNSLLGL